MSLSTCGVTGLALAMTFFLGSACTLHQGRVPPLDAQALYQQSRDMVARGDLVAASNLVDRLQREHPGSVFGILGTLERLRLGSERIDAARVGVDVADYLPAVDLCPP